MGASSGRRLERWSRKSVPYDGDDDDFSSLVAFQSALHFDVIAIIGGQKVGTDE